MATRSTIIIEGISTVKVYKHYDGYPEAMLEWLEEFNHDFARSRGDDPEYKIAQLLRNSATNPHLSSTSTNGEDLTSYQRERYTGWGIVGNYGDGYNGEEYEYTLHTDGSVSWKHCKFNLRG